MSELNIIIIFMILEIIVVVVGVVLIINKMYSGAVLIMWDGYLIIENIFKLKRIMLKNE